MKKGIILSVLVLLGACASMQQANVDWIAIGPDFPPNKSSRVEVVADKADIKRPYGNLGLLRIKNLNPDRDSIKRGVARGRKIAASKGADVVLLGQYNSAEDGAPVPKVTLIIYAIKYVDNLSDADKKAIEEFEVLGILNERSDR